MKRTSNWIATYSGIHFYPFEPKVTEVKIGDIAHALSNICRFNGHTSPFYSVAQHSLFVSRELQSLGASPLESLYGLLHDGSEAYICDLPTPVKQMLPEYMAAEKELQRCVYKALVGRVPTDEELRNVFKVDKDALYAEALLMTSDSSWVAYRPITATKIECNEHRGDVEADFVNRYYELLKVVSVNACKK